jgi:hypothetical protein
MAPSVKDKGGIDLLPALLTSLISNGTKLQKLISKLAWRTGAACEAPKLCNPLDSAYVLYPIIPAIESNF